MCGATRKGLVLLMGVVLAAAEAAYGQAHDGRRGLQNDNVEIGVRLLLPLLAPIRREIGREISVESGTLPPSPFTGERSTLAAVTIGTTAAEVDEVVLAAMDRLLAWDRQARLPADDRELAQEWLDQLRRRVLSRMAAGGAGVDCPPGCVVQHLTQPRSLFGVTPHEQQRTRDEILLEAFVAAVETRRPQ